MRHLRLVAVFVVLGFLSSACHKSETGASQIESSGQITDILFAAQLFVGAPRITPSSGTAPAGNGGPIANVNGPNTISGESQVAFSLDSSTAFQRVIVTVPGKTGFIQVDLPAPTTAQSVLLAFNALGSNVTVQFQLATGAGAVGPAAAFPLTVVSGKVGGLSAIISPDPIPFSGKTCTMAVPPDPNFGCIFETRMTLTEIGGVNVNITQYTATWTFGGAASPRVFTSSTLPSGETSIPASSFRVFPVLVRCSTQTCDGSFYAASGGTVSVAITGTDDSGHAVNFKSQFVLRPQ